MFICTIYYQTFTFRVTYAILNNSFGTSGKGCVQISHHLHGYEMPLFASELSSRLRAFF